MASSPRSGRFSWATFSHFGPPTAPNRIACEAWQRSSVRGGSGPPVASIAAPPTSASSNSNVAPARRATDFSTRTASGVTSWPMPSPGRTAILYVAMSWTLLGSDFLHPLPRRRDQPVDGRQIRPRARLDDVRRGALAGDDGAVEVELHRHLADRILARRRRAEGVVDQPPLHPGDGVDGGQHRVHRPVADARVLVRLPFLLQLHGGGRNHAGTADDVQVLELVRHLRLRDLVGHDGHEVLVVDLLLAVGEVLEGLERAVQLTAGEVEAELLEPRGERVPAGVLAEDELVRR